MKYFNTAGPVRCDEHYCLPPLERFDLEEILSLIEQKKYFVLHAPRQTGKTSCLLALQEYLNKEGKYSALYVNVEGAQAAREDVYLGIKTILSVMESRVRRYWKREIDEDFELVLNKRGPDDALREYLSIISEVSERGVILMLDEIDSLVGDTLISVLRQLRAGYIDRPDGFPQSIILCGGSGTRLWPLSRKLMPKQFLKLFSDKSLFQLTIERNKKVTTSQIVVSNEEQYFIALDQVEEIEESAKFLLESVAKNTAPAIARACMELDSEDIVLVTPSDHLIKNEKEYEKVVNKAKELAKQNYLVTFGIKPTKANTGYGYIECVVSSKQQVENSLDVKKFHEKPDLETAKKYLEINTTNYSLPTTNYYWNSGMFCFKAGVFLDELKEHSPEIYESVKEAYKNRKIDNNQTRIPFEYMEKIVEDSIDYAVMEKSKKVKVIPSDIDWNDVGSFDSLVDEIESNKAIEIDSKITFIIQIQKIK